MPTVEIEAGGALALTTALLVYQNREDELLVTRHDVERGVIQAGEPLDVAAFRKLLDRAEEAAATSSKEWVWQFPRLMAESPERRLWWSPSGYKSVFIGDDGVTPKVSKSWIPALVWCAHRSRAHCYLWAYDGGNAPTAQTDIYRPQFGPNHIHGDSSICVGSSKLDGFTPESWERAFWNSRFKTNAHLKRTKPYACNKAFPKVGTLAGVLPCGASAD